MEHRVGTSGITPIAALMYAKGIKGTTIRAKMHAKDTNIGKKIHPLFSF
jgi:hypothetical protein